MLQRLRKLRIDRIGVLVLLISFFSAALAAPIQIGGIKQAQAVALLGTGPQGLVVEACNDAGVAPDAKADGIWSCAAFPSANQVGVLKDGGLTLLPCVPNQQILMGVKPQCDAPLTPIEGAVATAIHSQVLVQLAAAAGAGAPVAVVEADGSRVQLPCRDDGRFPDVSANDGRFGCSGALPGPEVRFSWNGADGSGKVIGQVRWERPAPVQYLTISEEDKVSTAPFVIALEPQAMQGVPPSLGGATSSNMDSPPAGPYRWSALALTGLVGLGLGWWLRRPGLRLPEGFSLVPLPPLLLGAPSLPQRVILRCSDPAALGASLVAQVGTARRVVVVGPWGLQESMGQVYVCQETERVTLEKSLQSLIALPGDPVIVFLLVPLQEMGGVGGHPVVHLAEALGNQAQFVALLKPDQPGWSWPEWSVSGPPWRVEA